MPVPRRLVVLIAFMLLLLLQAQWAFAVHEHESTVGAGDACEICHHAQHGKVLPATTVQLPASPQRVAPAPTPIRSVPRAFRTVLARGPPPALPC